MSWLATIAPGFALKREINRRRLDRLKSLGGKRPVTNARSFESIQGGRLRYDILSPKNSPNSAIKDGIEGLRNTVRQLEYNNGFVSGPIKRIVNNVVGTGFQFQGRVREDEDKTEFPTITEDMARIFNRSTEKWFKRWSARSDRRLSQCFQEQVATAEGALVRDGEVLAVGRESKRRDRIIPYCVELLEADRLMTPMSEANNPKIRNGIRYDEEGVPEAYFVLKSHPGETLAAIMGKSSDFEEIPAFNKNGTRKVMHLFNPLRPEQSRGFSEFASALKDFQDLDRYREAEIMAMLEDACMTGIVKTEVPATWQQNSTVDDTGEDGSGEKQRIHEFAPNKWHYLNPGEDVHIHSPSRPNEAFGEMTNQLLSGPASALDVPPEILTQNWKGMNYSNARTVLLMFYLSCRVRQTYLIRHLCIPVYENVLTQLVIRGKAKAFGFDRRRDDYLAHGWIPPGWQWVDPVKEASGKKIELDNSMETLADIGAARGKDWEENLEHRARELKKIKMLEEKYGVKFPDKTGAPVKIDDDKEDKTMSGGISLVV